MVAETRPVSGAAIVPLVGVEHEHMAGQAVAHRAPITEGLNADRRDPHPVRVVPVRGERMAAEERAHALEPGAWGSPFDPADPHCLGLHKRSRPRLFRDLRLPREPPIARAGAPTRATAVFDQAIAVLISSLAAAITPGPSNVMITATGSARGLTRGIPCVLGTSLGMALLLFCAAAGVGQLVLGHPAIMRAMNWGGATFLLWLAWRIATAEHTPAARAAEPVGFLAAALFQWINPKGWLVGLGAAATFLDTHCDDRIAQAAW